MCPDRNMKGTAKYDPNALIAEYGYNPFEISMIPLGGQCYRCLGDGAGTLSWYDCVHFGGFPKRRHMFTRNLKGKKFEKAEKENAESKRGEKLRKEFHRNGFANLRLELEMFRNEIIFPILGTLEQEIRTSRRLNLLTSMRHSKFEDGSMDLSDTRKLSPEVTFPGIPLFPMQLRDKDTREIMEMIQHLFLVFGEILRTHNQDEIEIYVYLQSGAEQIYSYAVAKEKFISAFPDQVTNWSIFDMFYDREAETIGGFKDHGFHRVKPYIMN